MDRINLERDLEKLHPQSYGWALTCCAFDADEAEDALQSTYLKILDGKARFDGHSSLKTWLFSVLRRTAVERRRSAFLRRLGLGKSPALQEPSKLPVTPDHCAEETERRREVLAALASLARRQRQVLDLVYYHDLTVQEASEVMGLSVGSARVHFHRGKKNLRKKLEQRGLP